MTSHLEAAQSLAGACVCEAGELDRQVRGPSCCQPRTLWAQSPTRKKAWPLQETPPGGRLAEGMEGSCPFLGAGQSLSRLWGLPLKSSWGWAVGAGEDSHSLSLHFSCIFFKGPPSVTFGVSNMDDSLPYLNPRLPCTIFAWPEGISKC